MVNGYRRTMLAATYLLGMVIILVALAVLLVSGNGVSREEQIGIGVGLAFVSFALVQTFDTSLWEVLPPAFARLLGIYADRDDHRPGPGGGTP